MKYYPLLTRDEAVTLVGTAALRLAEALEDEACPTERAMRLITGQGSAARLGQRTRCAWSALRRALTHAAATGWDDVIEGELAGAASYLGREPDAGRDRLAA